MEGWTRPDAARLSAASLWRGIRFAFVLARRERPAYFSVNAGM